MNTQRAAVALRHIIVGGLSSPAGDSLVGLNTYELPDGAEGYVVATLGDYRLVKTLAPGDAPGSSPQYVAPSTGPGTWVLQNAGSASSSVGFEGAAGFTGAAAQSVPALNWHALPVGGAFYEVTAPGPDWAISATTGILTYSGVAKRFLVTATFSAYCSTTETSFAQTVDIDLTRNGALLGTADSTQSSSQAALGNTGFPTAVTHQHLISAAPGDHWQHVFRTLIDGTDSVGFTRYTIVITAP